MTPATRTVEALNAAAPTILGDLVTSYDPFNGWLQAALRAAAVTVAPRFGRWDSAGSPPAAVTP